MSSPPCPGAFLSPSGLLVDVPRSRFEFRAGEVKHEADPRGAELLLRAEEPHSEPVFVVELPEEGAKFRREESRLLHPLRRRSLRAGARADPASARRMGLVTLHFERNPRNRCPICPAEPFRGSKRLEQHLKRVHLKLTPARCQICGFRTEVKGDLKRHRKGTRTQILSSF